MYNNISCNLPVYIPKYLISNRDKIEILSNVNITNSTKIRFYINESNGYTKYMNIEKYISKIETIIATIVCNNSLFIFTNNKVVKIDKEKKISRITIESMDKNTLQNAFVSLGDKIYYFVNNKINILDSNTMKVSYVDLETDYEYYFASVMNDSKIIFTMYDSSIASGTLLYPSIYNIETNEVTYQHTRGHADPSKITRLNLYFTHWGSNDSAYYCYILNKNTGKFYDMDNGIMKNMSNHLSTDNCICTLFFDKLFILNKDNNSIWCMDNIDSDPYLIKEIYTTYKTISFFIRSNINNETALCILTENFDIIEYNLDLRIGGDNL